MSYGTPYIATPITKPYRVGRTFTKMSNSNNKAAEPKAPKAKYAKTRGEHYKDIVIAILIAGIIAFIGGMHFANTQHDAIDTAVKAVQPTASAQAPVKK